MIPAKTQQKLATDFAEGTRHKAMMDIAISLIGNGLSQEAVTAELSDKFKDAENGEIRKVVEWAAGKPLTPTPGKAAEKARISPTPPPAVLVSKLGLTGELKSPVPINGGCHASQLLRALYAPEELLNIVCKFKRETKKGVEKANPSGAGSTRPCSEWLKYFDTQGPPASEAGAWFRFNPVACDKGSGANGAITNADVADFRYLLLESDTLPVKDQLGVYSRLRLPVSVILTSGGKSAHAWLRIDAADENDYADKAQRILALLLPLGFDQANKNPSRLSRLPGVIRKIGADGEGKQELLFLDPDAAGITEEQITRLAWELEPPKFLPKPVSETRTESIALYKTIASDKARTGLRTGFNRFDSITGGLKPGWLTIVAGETNAGKTSFTLNIINYVVGKGHKVALFSYEMDYLEINDILYSMTAGIDRNKFNHGHFHKDDWKKLDASNATFKWYALDVYDDSSMTITDIAQVCERIEKLELIVIDYLQLMPASGYRDSREQQVASLSRGAKTMAKALKCPVIALSQLNDEGKLRESRSIGHDANCVIVLEPDDEQMEAKIVKGRSIPKGSFYFKFDPVICRFTETGCDQHLERLIPLDPL